MKRSGRCIPCIAFLLFLVTVIPAHGQDEHLPYGISQPDAQVLHRNAYDVQYDFIYRIPMWVAYHLIPEYRKTPERKGRFKSFRTDESVQNPVKDADYTNSGYARGHLAPFFISGGDRDGDGKYAKDDPDDELTIYQINYMSNITPQSQKCFNGSGAVWYQLEEFERKLVDEHNAEIWSYAGSVFNNENYYIYVIGPNEDIAVPDAFFKIILQKQADGTLTALAFLFPHYEEVHGQCNDDNKDFDDPSHFVSVDDIEALTGVDFFPDLPDGQEIYLEGINTKKIWDAFYSDY